MPELELKFGLLPEQAAKVQTELRGAPQRLQARYFDTPDRRLAAARVALRLRQEDASWVQTCKSPGAAPDQREEENVDRPTAPGAAEPALDPDAHAGTRAGAALHAALAGAADLKETFRTDVRRLRRRVSVPGARVELALDRGEIVAGPRREPILELEIELITGAPAGLYRIARRWVERHGLWLDTRSKAERGGHLAAGEAGAAPIKAAAHPAVGVAAATDEAGLLRALAASALQQTLANASEIAGGRETPAHVHQLRIALRRLRTVLRAFGPAAPSLAGGDEPLAQAARALGRWRDPGVTAASITPRLQRAGAPLAVLPPPLAGVESPAATVRALPLQLALLDVLEFVSQPTPAATADAGLDRRLAARLQKLHRQVREAGRRFEALPLVERHRARKRLKRLRYLVEGIAPRFKGKAVKRYLAVLERAQDALGTHNDVAAALEQFKAATAADPRAWFAVGWLVARLEVCARASRKALAALDEVQRFWR